MKITLILNGHLRHFRGKREEVVELSGGESLGEVLERLAIPHGDVMALVIDGKRFDYAHVPQEGSVVEVIPSISGG
ncbi:MAG: MoaD/ThiS family protein [Candidatus Eremiobacteraeota bacterium]|nr:MoaD/ThiS family protein [Candidatus Eremiobacteraeota bacterium]